MQSYSIKNKQYKSVDHTSFKIVDREELRHLQEIFPSLKTVAEKRDNLDRQTKLILFNNG
jgi:hypothetical protein